MQPHESIQPAAFGIVGRGRLTLAWAVLLCAVLSGCAALTNPVADGVPVHRLPPEVHGRRKDEERTIPLTLLRQKPPAIYRLAPGDVLGVWIEGVLGDKAQPPPLQIAAEGGRPPAFGYPIPVADNGTITLPFIDPIPVDGKTLPEVQQDIQKAYTVTKKILQPGSGKFIVTLMRPRTYHILVVRQDTGAVAIGGPSVGGGTAGGTVGQTKRGTGYTIDLPAYENDVLNALAKTGGLPGLDAENEVIIQRGSFADFEDPEALRHCLDLQPSGGLGVGGPNWVRIPLRMRPGERPPFRPEDVVLHDGDIVFIEARDTEVFYTAGLLLPRQYPLPRDYDLDIIEAIGYTQGPLNNGGVSVNNLSGNLLQGGIGFPSPSLVTILRRTPGGGQIPIRIDLNKALRDRRERVLIQPGDVIVLQETPLEAITRYVTDVFRFDFLGTTIRQRDLTGTATLSLP